MLEVVLELDVMATSFEVDWNDIPALDATALKILRIERNDRQREIMERDKPKT
jgi:hypothetical protein